MTPATDVALRHLAAAAIGIVGPVVSSLAVPTASPGLVLAACAVVAAAHAVIPERLWPWRLALLAAAGLRLTRYSGPPEGVWLVAGLLLTDWSIRRRKPWPTAPSAPPESAIPVGFVMLLAAAAKVRSQWGNDHLYLMTAAVAVAILGLVTDGRLFRLIERASTLVARTVGRIGFALVAIPVVVVPWIGHRMLRVDILAWPYADAATSRWVARDRRDIAAAHPWSVESAVGRHPWHRRLRRRLAVPATIVTAVLLAAAVTVGPGLLDREGEPVPAAYEGQDWYPGYRAEIDWLLDIRVGFRHLRSLRMSDSRGRYVNVEDGVRLTWTPPVCDCRRLKLWMYGGSTTFGIGQRDQHTIASELARVAWESAGIALDVVNRGQPGQLHWHEAYRFAWDLTIHDPPDLVIFYDGVNELWGIKAVHDQRDELEPIDPLVEDLSTGIDALLGLAYTPAAPEGAALLPVDPLPEFDEVAYGRRAVERYERSREISRGTAAANGVEARWFWQPSRFSRAPVEGEPDHRGSREVSARALYRAAETRVPAGVTDVTDAFEDTPGPLFSDEVHHNELGAAVMAERLLRELEPDLRRLAGEP